MVKGEYLPEHYKSLRKRFGTYFEALSGVGRAARAAGPLDEKTSQLIQLGAAAAVRSEGAVHSHARRALQAGARPDELRHALLLATSVIGFPAVAAALSWVEDVLRKPRRKA